MKTSTGFQAEMPCMKSLNRLTESLLWSNQSSTGCVSFHKSCLLCIYWTVTHWQNQTLLTQVLILDAKKTTDQCFLLHNLFDAFSAQFIDVPTACAPRGPPPPSRSHHNRRDHMCKCDQQTDRWEVFCVVSSIFALGEVCASEWNKENNKEVTQTSRVKESPRVCCWLLKSFTVKHKTTDEFVLQHLTLAYSSAAKKETSCYTMEITHLGSDSAETPLVEIWQFGRNEPTDVNFGQEATSQLFQLTQRCVYSVASKTTSSEFQKGANHQNSKIIIKH